MSSSIETSSFELHSLHDLSSRQPEQSVQPLPLTTEIDDTAARVVIYQHLHPTDKGFAAWRLLCTAFVFEALLWGFPLSFGVFQNYYSQLPQFAHSPYIPIVGTVASGISYLGAPIVTPVMKRYPKYQRRMIWLGWPICIAGLAIGSFATALSGLIITQGVMYGIGFLIFYYPILSFVNEFWIERRGMAYGLLCSASGVSGIVMPFVVAELLNKYGYPTTLRAIAVALAILTGPLIPSLKGRLPPPSQNTIGKTDWRFLKSPLFWVYSTSNFIQGLGYFFPSLYLPSYATTIGLSATQGALLLALLSVSQVLGQFCFGSLSDRRLSLDLLLVTSTFISAIACLALWRFAHSLTHLVVFSLFYGFFGAGYVAMWARMGTAVSEEPTAALAMFSWFCFGKGVGNVSAGPISASLLSYHFLARNDHETKYTAVILFTGVCMLLSGAIVGIWHVWSKIMRNGGEVGPTGVATVRESTKPGQTSNT